MRRAGADAGRAGPARGGRADPACLDCGGILKTATVMFGEELDPVVLGQAAAIARACEVMVAVGTSLQVYPAAGLAASRPTAARG